MPDPNEVAALARRFLDLWQEQAAAALTDPALAEILTRAAVWPAAETETVLGGKAETAIGDAGRKSEHRTPPTGDTGADGTETAAAASGDGNHAVDEFARRLAECAARLAALEPPPREPGG